MPLPSNLTLESLAAVLPQPPHQLLGRRPGPLVLPDNIVCFQRRAASELNRPRRGRALHHRFVLILALRTTVGVCVDDRVIRLRAGEGLLVFPFQFHHYIEKDADKLFWLFITFDLADAESLQSMHYRPFTLTPEVRALGTQLITAYHEEGRMSELPALLLALLLARLRRQGPAPRHKHTTIAAPGMVMQVNQLAHRAGRTDRHQGNCPRPGHQPESPAGAVSRVVRREPRPPSAAPAAGAGLRPAAADPEPRLGNCRTVRVQFDLQFQPGLSRGVRAVPHGLPAVGRPTWRPPPPPDQSPAGRLMNKKRPGGGCHRARMFLLASLETLQRQLRS